MNKLANWQTNSVSLLAQTSTRAVLSCLLSSSSETKRCLAAGDMIPLILNRTSQQKYIVTTHIPFSSKRIVQSAQYRILTLWAFAMNQSLLKINLYCFLIQVNEQCQLFLLHQQMQVRYWGRFDFGCLNEFHHFQNTHPILPVCHFQIELNRCFLCLYNLFFSY